MAHRALAFERIAPSAESCAQSDKESMTSRRTFIASMAGAGASIAAQGNPLLISPEPRPLADVHTASVTQLAAAIRRREVSSVEVVETFLRRIEAVNPKLNAVVQLDRDRAISAARNADVRLRRRERIGPLHGVPMTIKDSFDTAGMISAAGTLGRKNFVPKDDATAVTRLRKAGAILLGKTNCAEITLAYETDNLVY